MLFAGLAALVGFAVLNQALQPGRTEPRPVSGPQAADPVQRAENAQSDHEGEEGEEDLAMLGGAILSAPQDVLGKVDGPGRK